MSTARTMRTDTWLIALLLSLATLPFLSRLFLGWTSADLVHYMVSAEAAVHGDGIYTKVPFEYPPYALAWFMLPLFASKSIASYRLAFGVMIWVLDALIKAALLIEGRRAGGHLSMRAIMPFAIYTLGTAALAHILLQRFDVIPAALSLMAVLAWQRGRARTAGVLLGIGIGTKLYPALLLIVLALVARRDGRQSLPRLIAGASIGMLPMLLVAPWMPWWHFLAFHEGRGLEAESLWASLLWLGHDIVPSLPVRWETLSDWTEVTGPLARAIVTPAQVVWVVATLGAAAFVAPRAARATGAPLAPCLLLPLAAFVILSPVLSPQYHLWLLPLCALALMPESPMPETARRLGPPVWIIAASVLLVPAFFPSRTFDTGLDPGRTLVLVLRNLLLVSGVFLLCVRIWRLEPHR